MFDKRGLFTLIAALMVAALVLSACGPAAAPEATEAPAAAEPTEAPAAAEPTEAAAEEVEEPAEEPAEEMPEVAFAYPPGGFLEKAVAGEYAGTTVVVDGPLPGENAKTLLHDYPLGSEDSDATLCSNPGRIAATGFAIGPRHA